MVFVVDANAPHAVLASLAKHIQGLVACSDPSTFIGLVTFTHVASAWELGVSSAASADVLPATTLSSETAQYIQEHEDDPPHPGTLRRTACVTL